MEDLRERIRAIADQVLEMRGVWLVDLELAPAGRRLVVRIYIDKPGGVTVGDCATASRHLEDALDVADAIPGSYFLEVSSPGLERPLRRPAEYEYFTGRRVRLVTRTPVAGASAVAGAIVEATSDLVVLRLDDGSLLSLPFEQIASAHLDAELWNKPEKTRTKRGKKKAHAR